MKALVKGNVVTAFAPNIEFGTYNEDFEKWKLSDEEGELMFYVLDNEYTLVEGVEIPEDYVDGKYFFENGELVLNEDWQPPLPSAEERIAELERLVANLNGDTVWDELAIAIEEGVNNV